PSLSTLSLHDALPILQLEVGNLLLELDQGRLDLGLQRSVLVAQLAQDLQILARLLQLLIRLDGGVERLGLGDDAARLLRVVPEADRKSTRLNSSHVAI